MSQTPTTDFVRVHPVSPFIRGGLVVLGVLGYLVSQQIDTLAAAFGGGDDDSGPGGPAGPLPGVGTLLQAGAVGLVVVASAGMTIVAGMSSMRAAQATPCA